MAPIGGGDISRGGGLEKPEALHSLVVAINIPGDISMYRRTGATNTCYEQQHIHLVSNQDS